MLLSIFERLLVLNISKELTGDIIAIRAIREFTEEVSPTPEEVEKSQLSINGGSAKWKEGEVPDKEIKIEEFIRKKVSDILVDLSKKEKLKPEHLSLYDKFVEDEV